MALNNTYDIVKALDAIENELIASMIRNMKKHKLDEIDEDKQWTMWQAEQLKSLEKYRRKNREKFGDDFKEINEKIEFLIRHAKDEGEMDQEIAILKAIKNGFKANKASKAATVEFFQLNEEKLEALIKATVSDMEKAETAILRRADDQYRKIIYNAQVYANSGAGTYEKAVDMATKDMLFAGLNCVEYANGARHTLRDYADMAIKTATKRAYLQGEGTKRQEWGIPTVIVNKRQNPCPKCLPFCGKVLIDDVWSDGSKDGISPVTGLKYQLMSDAVAAGLYHPRCKDVHTTYFEGVNTPPDSKYTRDELDQMAENYRREQKQQYAKRQAEKYGRLSSYSLDPENKQKYSLKEEQWNEIFIKSDYKEEFMERSLRTKNDNLYGVNWKIVKSKEYTNRFSELSDNLKANMLAAKRSRNILVNRDGKNTEELYAISLTNGKDVSSITNQHVAFGVNRTDKFNDDILRAECRNEKILLIHNHPRGLPPSIADINELLNHKTAVGITVGHNGTIYYYTKPNKKITKFDVMVAMRKCKKYNNIEFEEEYLEILSKQFEFEFKKL